MKKTSTKRILVNIGVILLLILLVGVGSNLWLKYQLPIIIREKNKSDYNITYQDLNVSLLNRKIVANNIIVVPKKTLFGEEGKIGLYARVRSVEVNGFSIWDLLFTDRIKASNIHLSSPEVTLYKPDEESPEEAEKNNKEFAKLIFVSDLYVHNGNFSIMSVQRKLPVFAVANISLQVEGILVTEETLKRKIPLTFQEYSFSCDSLRHKFNPQYTFSSSRASATQNSLRLEDVRILPVQSRTAFVKSLAREKDHFHVTINRVASEQLTWGYRKDDLFLKISDLTLDGLRANIYRPKMPPDDPSVKKLYSRQLRELPVNLELDKLTLKNSHLVYEEEKSDEAGPGMIKFTNFFMTATNITSAKGRTSSKPVNIDVQCRFMGIAPMTVNWRFNVFNRADQFSIKGSIKNFPAERLEPFTKPYTNTKMEGDLQEIYFNFTGNNDGARGNFAMRYDDLKVKIYRKKDRDKKNKVLTAIATIFVKKDSRKELKEVEVEASRLKDRSFFNLLWRTIADGLKKILL